MKIIQRLIYVLVALLLISLIANSVISIMALVFEDDVLQLNHFGTGQHSLVIKYIAITKAIVLILFCVGIFYLLKILRSITKGVYFSNYLISDFKRSGIYFIFSGALGFLINLTPFIIKDIKVMMYLSYDSKSLNIVLIIIGLLFVLFCNVINQGNLLKHENDLTI